MNKLDLIKKAQELTQKKKVFILNKDNVQTETEFDTLEGLQKMVFGEFNKLTFSLANTFGNVAAIVVTPALYGEKYNLTMLKRVKQLASAEGAMLIWDETQSSEDLFKARLNVIPDMVMRTIEGEQHYEINESWS